MRALKVLGTIAALLLAVLVVALLGVYLTLRASLPQLDGTRQQDGLHGAVTVTRDARGVPTILATDRDDLAYATGFLHAQDRFFQMELLRRAAAGELSELFGKVALEHDRQVRLFRFRSVARQVLEQASPAQRAELEAYTRGVNAGLAALGSRPFEYWLLGQKPAPWRAEDSLLVEYAMWWDLQANGFRREILRQEINARLGGDECGSFKCALSFLYPRGTSWDAPVLPDATPLVPAPIPAPAALNVRDKEVATARAAPREAPPLLGSNNWAVAGSHTATGAALVANDMHLAERVPPVWYHARLRLNGTGATAPLDLNGVTLPGTPFLVAGSNGHVAWGFTNSYGNWLTVKPVHCASESALELTSVSEPIAVKGEPTVAFQVRSGADGVLLRTDAKEQTCWFGSWLAAQPQATNLNLAELEQVTSVAQALALAPGIGMPHQNLMVGDAAGHIGWTISGRVPEDTGASRARGEGAWTTAADHPQVQDPPLGRLWSANARVASDARQQELIGGELAALGAEYDLGARAGQIRDDLLALTTPATPADMLRIQLDDRALFLTRWRTLLLGLMDADSVRGSPQRAAFRRLIETWDAHAGVDSVGYRLLRAFRERTQQAVWDMLLAGLDIAPDEEDYPPAQFEGPLWELVTRQPLHLLAKNYPDWPQFLRAQADRAIADLSRNCPELGRCTWGARNEVRVRHPLSRALPAPLAAFLDMPTVELPGDHDMPRVQDGTQFGASERFAVSPGHEEQGYLHIPGGQSGHPLSPYYRAGFLAWARGEPLPFLPGPTEHTLTLAP
jgi:penicillin G amidase